MSQRGPDYVTNGVWQGMLASVKSIISDVKKRVGLDDKTIDLETALREATISPRVVFCGERNQHRSTLCGLLLLHNCWDDSSAGVVKEANRVETLRDWINLIPTNTDTTISLNSSMPSVCRTLKRPFNEYQPGRDISTLFPIEYVSISVGESPSLEIMFAPWTCPENPMVYFKNTLMETVENQAILTENKHAIEKLIAAKNEELNQLMITDVGDIRQLSIICNTTKQISELVDNISCETFGSACYVLRVRGHFGIPVGWTFVDFPAIGKYFGWPIRDEESAFSARSLLLSQYLMDYPVDVMLMIHGNHTPSLSSVPSQLNGQEIYRAWFEPYHKAYAKSTNNHGQLIRLSERAKSAKKKEDKCDEVISTWLPSLWYVNSTCSFSETRIESLVSQAVEYSTEGTNPAENHISTWPFDVLFNEQCMKTARVVHFGSLNHGTFCNPRCADFEKHEEDKKDIVLWFRKQADAFKEMLRSGFEEMKAQRLRGVLYTALCRQCVILLFVIFFAQIVVFLRSLCNVSEWIASKNFLLRRIPYALSKYEELRCPAPNIQRVATEYSELLLDKKERQLLNSVSSSYVPIEILFAAMNPDSNVETVQKVFEYFMGVFVKDPLVAYLHNLGTEADNEVARLFEGHSYFDGIFVAKSSKDSTFWYHMDRVMADLTQWITRTIDEKKDSLDFWEAMRPFVIPFTQAVSNILPSIQCVREFWKNVCGIWIHDVLGPFCEKYWDSTKPWNTVSTFVCFYDFIV